MALAVHVLDWGTQKSGAGVSPFQSRCAERKEGSPRGGGEPVGG